jgi:heptosyltransferase-3
MSKPTQRVLIYLLGSLGDTVVALPALHLVARQFPNAERRMLTNFPVSAKAPAASAILAENGLVHGYFRYSVGTRSVFALLQLMWTLLRWRPQVLVYLTQARGIPAAQRDARFFRLCGIRRQIGVPLNEAMQEHQRQPEHGLLEHEYDRLARNLSELGDCEVNTQAAWDLGLSQAEKACAQAALAPAGGRKVLAVGVGTKVQSKDWGKENWKALLTDLGTRYPDHALALMGAAEEAQVSEFAAEGWRAGAGPQALVLNLCGQLSPRESAAALQLAELFIGHDSGPMHLAAAVGTRCVAVFAARNIPRVWFPRGECNHVVYHAVDCMGCRIETCIVERKKCISSISVGEMVNAVRSMLEPT